MTHKLRFMGVNRDTETAGPGKRLEFFTKGCIRGVISPCEGCFNESTWTFAGAYREMTVEEVVDVALTSWNKQITFCGGEPILQARALAEVAKRLKNIDSNYHFVMYTAYKLDTLMKYGLHFTWLKRHGQPMLDSLLEYAADIEIERDTEGDPIKAKVTVLSPDDVLFLMQHVDLIVDGDYQHDKRLTTSQYMHEGWFIGSSNQRVISAPQSVTDGRLVFLYADEYNKIRSSSNHCRSCGHILPSGKIFCKTSCASNYSTRKKELELLGGI